MLIVCRADAVCGEPAAFVVRLAVEDREAALRHLRRARGVGGDNRPVMRHREVDERLVVGQ
jgi:hypothetical protein